MTSSFFSSSAFSSSSLGPCASLLMAFHAPPPADLDAAAWVAAEDAAVDALFTWAGLEVWAACLVDTARGGFAFGEAPATNSWASFSVAGLERAFFGSGREVRRSMVPGAVTGQSLPFNTTA